MSKKSNKRSITKENLEKEVLKILQFNPKKSFNYKQIAKVIGIKRDDYYNLINVVLEDLYKKEKVIELGRGKYKYRKIIETIKGIVEVTSTGNAYVIVDGMDQDIFIQKRYVPNTVNGDLVAVLLHSKHKKYKPEGEILEVIEHNNTQFVGIVDINENFAFVTLPNPKIHFDVFLPKSELKGVKNGQKIIVNVEDWGDKKNSPSGKLVEVLGYPGEHHVEIHSILAEYDLPYEFDEELEVFAKNIPSVISTEEIKKRRDFRSICTFTIDPHDAKDFDDALSIQKLENNNWEIGIHIADVSHYIKENDELDIEAKERATSVYLVDRVVPMLPEVLSNNLCSLRPNEEKLCFSAVFEITENAEIKSEWFGKTIINSNHRFSYEDAQRIIEENKGDYNNEIFILNKIAKVFRQKRMKSGAFSFERSETKFNIDKEGNPISIYFKESKDAHKLIEEFMLLANKKVAEYIGKQSLPFVYRIHDSPDPDKLDTLSLFIKRFGYSLQTDNKKTIADSINKVLKQIQGKQECNMIETLAIRTMAKAIYTTENIGHYGLAFNHYTHFTSPIRRYPDVLVHRLLEHYLNKGHRLKIDDLEKTCKHSTEMEIIASKAERDSIKYMQAKFMSKQIGKVFDGIISGVTDFGIFIEIDNTGCEGLIRMRDIPGDFYKYIESEYCIEGTRTKKKFTLGGKVRVKIIKVIVERKEIDMVLV
jgi:ribonuclease R